MNLIFDIVCSVLQILHFSTKFPKAYKKKHFVFLKIAAYFEKEMLKRQQSREDEGIDVDDAIEKLDITEHNPQKYLDILKKSVEGDPNSSVKVA